MMRIAIAGSSGLARTFAHFINDTVHPFIILSRGAKPDLEALGFQVTVVEYSHDDELRYALRGIDLIISTVSGTAQINLIDAAANSGVRRFVPAEFQGPPARRSQNDQDHVACMERLRHWQHHHHHPLRFTVFSCGVFYERFARGGLTTVGIGHSHPQSQGPFLMDIEYSVAEVVERDSRGRPIYLCLTSVNDLANFIVAALDLGLQNWPSEFRMYGDRMTVSEVLQWGEFVKGGAQFSTSMIAARDLPAHLHHATYYQDYAKANRIQELINTEARGYDFERPNLNALVNLTPISFGDWLRAQWGAYLQSF